MRQIMENLFKLQKLELQSDKLSSGDQAKILKLREHVPEAILTHFSRVIARGKTAVSPARNGVCTECHLKITSGSLARLAHAGIVHVCDNCGRYLFLPENEPSSLNVAPLPVKAPPKTRARRSQKKADLHVA
jgi:hypothetical protein